MNCGVYEVKNIVTGDRYIGSSVDLRRRKKYHRDALKRGDHTNIHLQRAYNKYGKNNFRFSIILYCDPDNTTILEQVFLDAGLGHYNIAVDATSPNKGKFGEDASFYGRKHTLETRKKISKNHADVSGENHPLYGKRHSKETRRKISANRDYTRGEDHPAYGIRGENSPSWGRKHTEESKRKMSEIKKEYWKNKKDRNISEEQKEKISKGLKEYYKNNDAKPRDKEWRKKLSEAAKRYYQNKNDNN